MRLLVSGGGTAGHVSPILATVAALQSLDSSLELLYVGQAGSVEERITTAAKIDFAAISAGKFRREHGRGWQRLLADPQSLFLNTRDLARVGRGILQSLLILHRFRPDVIFIKGGYVGLPVGVAARWLHIPYVIHESDLEPGLANRLLAPRAAAVAVGFPAEQYRSWHLPEPPVFTGSPVRTELLNYHRLEGLAHFKLRSELPVILVTGGSQGARQLNDVIIQSLDELLPHAQIIHLTGEAEIDRVRFETRRLGAKLQDRYRPLPFLLHDMGMALAAADVVVARAGAQTIAELAILGKPAILIPNDQMAGHQVANARLLSRAGAARMLTGERLTVGRLVHELLRLVQDAKEQDELVEAIRQFARPDAAQALAELILAQVPASPEEGK